VLNIETLDVIRSVADAERFWQLAILIGLRDKAERLEVRFTESGAILYHRVDGRDWELTPVDEELSPNLLPALQTVARLIAPERPSLEVFAPPEGSRFEQPQVGWLSCQIRSHWIDFKLEIDPQMPWGGITIDLPSNDDLANIAADMLADYYDSNANSELP
jgi:hypothetical protein